MAAIVDAWTGPGSGSNQQAPNTFFWISNAASQTVSTRCQFFNASGGLVTVDASFILWDLTAGASAHTQTGTGVNTLSIGPITMTSGHTYTHRITYNSGTSCDHCVATVTAISTSTSGHPVFFVRRSGAWVGVPGHQLRVRRSGAWAIINGGVYIRRTGAWVQP